MIWLLNVYDAETRLRLETLYHGYKKLLYAIAMSILKDHHEAQDIVQETMIKVSENMDKIDFISSPKTKAYLCMIVRNLAINRYNRSKKLMLYNAEEVMETSTYEAIVQEELFVEHYNKEAFEQYLKFIPSNYAEIITLRYYFELEIPEISDLLGITANNVSVRLSRALKNLKEIVSEGGVRADEKYI